MKAEATKHNSLLRFDAFDAVLILREEPRQLDHFREKTSMYE